MKISTILKRENNNLDLIRIILASLVIVGHTAKLNGSSVFWIDPVGHFFDFTYSGSLAVKLFFFISGLVVTNSLINHKSVTYFVISRIFRLMPALFFVLILTVLIFGPILTSFPLTEYIFNLKTVRYVVFNLLFMTAYSLPGVFLNNFFGIGV